MSDDRSHRSDGDESEGETGTSSGGLEPGGGPRRVVSERSVDDILDSLGDPAPGNESNGESRPAEMASETDDALPSEDDGAKAEDSVTVTFDEEGVPEATDEADGDAERTASSNDDDRSKTGPADDADALDESRAGSDDEADQANGGRAEERELETRIARGDVTGADVRAAEAGEGRESTPAVDEIELSLDDLEHSSQSTGPNASSDDGTARIEGDAARLDEDARDAGEAGVGISAAATNSTSPKSTDADDEEAGDSTGGVLGRIKGLFSG
ncbi:hypothetical protein AB7C87_09565 [Natrarchaeobius sp. A-rgal3]|uniref:hypothetical protein n=1 Tax=Natrarchaeobius versutus TaxID=1679078 RepID=UPI00350F15B7